MNNKDFVKFVKIVALYGMIIITLITSINYFVDASSVIRPRHNQLAKLALAGNTVATPENYNERVYQMCIVDNFAQMPENIVIGSSRGMFIGEEVTGYTNIYNNCVSGACLEDYYALLGLYFERFHAVPNRVIIEVSPWVFYTGNPDRRWMENKDFYESACDFFRHVNGTELVADYDSSSENPYLSLSYFRYNIRQWLRQGNAVFKEEARVSTIESEAADYPDGTIRYASDLENENEERLKKVTSTKGACTYENSDKMTEVDAKKSLQFESLTDYLIENGTEVIIYLQPFCVTQCYYSFDKGLNPGYPMAYEYLVSFAKKRGLKIYGGYDARELGLTDNNFIDSMHPDRHGTILVWNYSN